MCTRRGKDSGRADDQDEKVIRERLNVYQAQTAILKEYYKKQDKFEGVNGLGTIEEVFERLSNSITAAKQS